MCIRQKVNVLLFPIRWGLFLLLISAPQLLFAQEGDSTRIIRNNVQIMPENIWEPLPLTPLLKPVPSYPLPSPELSPGLSPELSNRFSGFSLKNEIRLPYQVNPSLLYRGDFYTGGVIKRFSNGEVFGSGGQTSVPGIGRFNDASLGYRHIFNDRLSLQLRASAMKINMSHITGQAFSTSGRLTYRASDRVAFNVFGSYNIGNTYGMGADHYGATMSLDMSKRFGMEMGVQRYYNGMRGHWETVPVVIPYYRFEKFTLGMDVGGILHELLRNVIFENSGGRSGGGPTLAPPRFSFPGR
ncbi:hypothetical protein [Bacteroides sp. UBA939]|uniref:hypothetical protein n=1 Tax=Bacteroides sp. UBA939 TaxID=1946092 RepID=UPI0025C52CCB|nr:hypothetical protein [Bacteroides sp. UBA939]